MPRRKKPTDDDLREAIKAVKEAWEDLVRARSIIPYPGDNAAGSIRYCTPLFYRNVEPSLNSAMVSFKRPLSGEDAERIKSAGHSVNEGYVLRLHAILDIRGLIEPKLDKEDVVVQHILLLKSLRNKIAHGKRKCKSDDKFLKELVKLRYSKKLVDNNPLIGDELQEITRDIASGNEFFWPLSILGVLKPLTEKVQEFIKRSLVESQGRT